MSDFHFHVHVNGEEHDHEHELVEVEIFSILDDDGNEIFYKEVGTIEHDGKTYKVCQEVFLDDKQELIVDEGEIHIFEEIKEGEDTYLDEVLDYDLAKKIFDIWEKMIEEEE